MTRLALCLLMALPLPAFAGTFTPPEGCTMTMTVQSRSCRVSNHYTCVGDQPGDKWRSDFDQEGIFFSSKIDNESQWIESYDIDPPVVQRRAGQPSRRPWPDVAHCVPCPVGRLRRHVLRIRARPRPRVLTRRAGRL